MAQVTAIRAGRGRRERVNVFLDGKFAFSVETELAVKERLHVGQDLSANRIEALTGSDHFHRCLNAAARYLECRPRSESELRIRLHRRGFDGDSIEAVIAKLKEQGFINDIAFAEFWKDNRAIFSPRSQRLTRLELRQKGVDGDIIDQVVDTIDDDESAYRAAQGKVRNLPLSDYQSFRHRLGGYLKRRGFGYSVVNHTIERVWQEHGSEPGDSIPFRH